ncbi:MAG: DUF4339 domain-containing protein [Akkermansia sp.]|nr:DUF4339 domain-containing protein [Akkermansia sp.]
MTETQYYIAKPGGKPTGPYTISALEAMAAARELTPEHIYCAEGMPQWLPITRIVDLPGAFPSKDILPTVPVQKPSPPPLAPPPVPTYRNEPKPNTHLVGGIVVLLFSFMMFILSMPFAIAVLVQAVRAESAWVDRMNDECLRLSISAGFWLKISVITMALQILLLVGGCLYFVSLMR